jgi:hypothetical protein
MLGWPLEEASIRSGISVPTIHRFEHVDGVPNSRSQTLLKLRRTFEDAGIEFSGSPDEGPGLRLWAKKLASPRKARDVTTEE